MLKVTDVDYVKDYELLDRDKFTQYGLTGYTIEWANGADLAPEFLHDIGVAA